MIVLNSKKVSLSSRYQRGVMFTYFSLIALPVVLFSLAIAVDFTRIIVANRAVGNAVDSAAAAAAWEFVPGTVGLDRTTAREAAIETLCAAKGADAMPNISDTGSSIVTCDNGETISIDVTFNANQSTWGGLPADGNPTVAQVSAPYKVSGLIFFPLFTGSGSETGRVSRVAEVCVPGDQQSSSVQGNCSRPTYTD